MKIYTQPQANTFFLCIKPDSGTNKKYTILNSCFYSIFTQFIIYIYIFINFNYNDKNTFFIITFCNKSRKYVFDILSKFT